MIIGVMRYIIFSIKVSVVLSDSISKSKKTTEIKISQPSKNLFKRGLSAMKYNKIIKSEYINST